MEFPLVETFEMCILKTYPNSTENRMKYSQLSFEEKQDYDRMMTPRVGDRVVVMKDGALVKARVAAYDEAVGVGVTFAKGEVPTLYNRKEVFILYRYEEATGPFVPVTLLCRVDQNV